LSQATDDHRSRARRGLARLLAADGPFEIVEAAFWVAGEEYPGLDVEHELQRVRIISAEGARRVYHLSNPFARLDGLQGYLYGELGFRGNLESYNDPLNCFLNEVLNRRLGIPITLSIIFLDVARAAGFAARGVGLPGHFVARVTYDERTLFVDPFNGGQVITEEDCRQLVARTTGRASLYRAELLEGTDERSMLGRLLRNMKHIYVEREDYARALGVVERLLMLKHDDPTEIRDRGFLQAHLGRPAAAITDLEAYLTRSPRAADAESVRGRVSWLRRKLSDMN
jgi:regulator of sirC expression with transglutaminase-like and TPR domain